MHDIASEDKSTETINVENNRAWEMEKSNSPSQEM